MLLREIAALDEVLHAHTAALGRDFTAYRNHTYRVVNLCVAFSSAAPEPLQKIAIAAAFHDLGIWTDGTFDYLQPSIRLARAHLARSGHGDWTPEITAMILEHHKISAYRANPHWLVEPFRRADWTDVSRGLVTFGPVAGARARDFLGVAECRLSQAARTVVDRPPARTPVDAAADGEAVSQVPRGCLRWGRCVEVTDAASLARLTRLVRVRV
jgi:hypothetical protein